VDLKINFCEFDLLNCDTTVWKMWIIIFHVYSGIVVILSIFELIPSYDYSYFVRNTLNIQHTLLCTSPTLIISYPRRCKYICKRIKQGKCSLTNKYKILNETYQYLDGTTSLLPKFRQFHFKQERMMKNWSMHKHSFHETHWL
jgi:hypothetical protein